MTVKHNLESPSRRKVGCVLSYFYSLPHLFFFHPRHSKILSLSFPFCFKSTPPAFAILLVGVLPATKTLALPPSEKSGLALPKDNFTGYRLPKWRSFSFGFEDTPCLLVLAFLISDEEVTVVWAHFTLWGKLLLSLSAFKMFFFGGGGFFSFLKFVALCLSLASSG